MWYLRNVEGYTIVRGKVINHLACLQTLSFRGAFGEPADTVNKPPLTPEAGEQPFLLGPKLFSKAFPFCCPPWIFHVSATSWYKEAGQIEKHCPEYCNCGHLMAMKYVGFFPHLRHARYWFLRGSINHGDNLSVTRVPERHRSGRGLMGDGTEQDTGVRDKTLLVACIRLAVFFCICLVATSQRAMWLRANESADIHTLSLIV